jgi:hypothetical protein
MFYFVEPVGSAGDLGRLDRQRELDGFEHAPQMGVSIANASRPGRVKVGHTAGNLRGYCLSDAPGPS